MKNKLEIVFIVDRSGSMGTIKNQMEEGINKLIYEQKEKDPESKLTVHLFDDKFEDLCIGVDVQYAPKVEIKPRGYTALWDAVGKSLLRLEERDFTQALVITVSDGFENYSKEFNPSQLKSIVERLEAKGATFVYLGANQDAIKEGSKFGSKVENTMTFSANPAAVNNLWNTMSVKLSAYRMKGNFEAFDDTDRSKSV